MARLGPIAELLPRGLADWEDRKRGQQRLHGHQRRRRGEDAEERGDHHDDRLEVVAEQVKARGPDVRDRRVPAGGLLDVLGVDGQIPRGRVELQQPEQRDGEIGGENGERGYPDERVPVGAGEPALTSRRGRGVRQQTLRYRGFTLRRHGLHGCRECVGPVLDRFGTKRSPLLFQHPSAAYRSRPAGARVRRAGAWRGGGRRHTARLARVRRGRRPATADRDRLPRRSGRAAARRPDRAACTRRSPGPPAGRR